MNGKTVRPDGRTIEEVCHRLLDDINRWSPEVQAGIRSTLWHGVFTKAHQQVEVLLKACASTMVAEAGDAGAAAVAVVGGGKPIAAMTMGQHVDLVRRLGSDLFGGEDRRLLDRLTELRNDFVHGRLPREHGPTRTVEFLSLAQELCRSRLVAAMSGAASEMSGSIQPNQECSEVTKEVRFRDGTIIRASSLPDRHVNADWRGFGLYADARWAPSWPAEVISWPDSGIPDRFEEAAEQICRAFDLAHRGEHVEVGCAGGIGRTGTILACMAVLAGEPKINAVKWVRENYDQDAVEPDQQGRPIQECWVERFADYVRGRTATNT